MDAEAAVQKTPFAIKGRKIWVAGHRGMVGSAIVRRLQSEDCEIITASRSELDLRVQADVARFIETQRPAAIFLAAAKVGGILANSRHPAEFLYENLVIETNIIHAAWQAGVEKLLFLGSSCIYPKFAQQPISESELLAGKLEPTNEAYAIAKIAGLKLCEAYRQQYGARFVSCMPTNLYGPHDNFDLTSSHVLPALLAKVHQAKLQNSPSVEIWGSGAPRREFLHVDDLADATIHLMKFHESAVPLNVGTGVDVTILELAETIKQVVGYQGSFVFDRSKPDGTPRKLLDVTAIARLGWTHRIALRDGVTQTYAWYKDNIAAKA
ncbi:MAG TPA: GDP-L-fucose synthase [Rhodopseudomonas sp.]|uniref:GDP-L-fucose synthase n=1 Tax=Rhodopseudomonas sp. TaxID=1078 RepID=UPI002ED889AA